jgi:hypothetical protein
MRKKQRDNILIDWCMVLRILSFWFGTDTRHIDQKKCASASNCVACIEPNLAWAMDDWRKTDVYYAIKFICITKDKKEASWYIGFGVGTGELKVEGETMEDSFEEYPSIDVGQELTFNFGVGKILNQKHMQA